MRTETIERKRRTRGPFILAELDWKKQSEDSTAASPNTERAPPLLSAALRRRAHTSPTHVGGTIVTQDFAEHTHGAILGRAPIAILLRIGITIALLSALVELARRCNRRLIPALAVWRVTLCDGDQPVSRVLSFEEGGRRLI